MRGGGGWGEGGGEVGGVMKNVQLCKRGFELSQAERHPDGVWGTHLPPTSHPFCKRNKNKIRRPCFFVVKIG